MESPSTAHLDDKHLRLLEWLTTLPEERGKNGIPRTKQELADELGVSPRTLRDWQSKADFIKVHEAEARRIYGGAETTMQIMAALVAQALDPESPKQVQAAKVWADMAGAIVPKARPEPVAPKAGTAGARAQAAQLTDEELDAKIAAQEAGVVAKRVIGGS